MTSWNNALSKLMMKTTSACPQKRTHKALLPFMATWFGRSSIHTGLQVWCFLTWNPTGSVTTPYFNACNGSARHSSTKASWAVKRVARQIRSRQLSVPCKRWKLLRWRTTAKTSNSQIRKCTLRQPVTGCINVYSLVIAMMLSSETSWSVYKACERVDSKAKVRPKQCAGW